MNMSKTKPPINENEDLRQARQAIKENNLKNDIERITETFKVVNLESIKDKDLVAIDTPDGETVIDTSMSSWIEWDEHTGEIRVANEEMAKLVLLITGGKPSRIKALAKNRSYRMRVLADEGGWIRMAMISKLIDQIVEKQAQARDPHKLLMELIKDQQERNEESRKKRRGKKDDEAYTGDEGAERLLHKLG